MKQIFTLAIFTAAILGTQQLNAQTIYRSATSGNWGTAATWETSTDGGITYSPAAGTPGASNDVIIKTGTVVTLDASGKNAKNLTIQSGATLKGGTAGEKTIRINGTTFQNDGTFGGAGDQITAELNTGNVVGGYTITGSGSSLVNRIRMVGGNTVSPTTTVVIDQNVTAQVGSNGLATSYALAADATPALTDNYIMTLAAGRTYTVTGGFWNNSGSSGGASTPMGNYTYNINGTLDMSSSTTTSNSTFIGSTDPTKAITANINGTVKLPTSGNSALDISENAATGQAGAVIFNISGLLDASIAPIKNTTATLPPRLFNIIGGGQLRRTVGGTASATVAFPVSAGGSNNTAYLLNAGVQDDYSVNVKTTIDNTPPTTKIVNRQWNVTELTVGGSVVSMTFSWQTADQAAGFNPASPVFIYHWNGASWDALPATVSGSGTASDPYTATSTGVTSFSPFIVGNSNALPIDFLSVNAVAKNNGVEVDWSTASESNVDKFIVERSSNGQTFSQAGIVRANGNTSSISNYSWFDANPFAGTNYYRVRSVDVDGSAKFTNIVKANVAKTNPTLVILSNPIRGNQLNIQLNGLNQGKYTLSLFNNNGQQVFSKSLLVEGNSINESISLPSIQLGIYTVQVTDGNLALTKKIVVQ